MKKLTTLSCLLVTICLLAGCATIDLYEKSVAIPKHEWQRAYQPSFDFTIKDTSARYKIFLVLRHTEKYNFSNIYVNLYVKGPGQDSARKEQRDIILATAEKGWLASGMDDVYEHRSLLAEQYLKAGDYHFTIEQIMRQDPLLHVLNVGLRLEKQP